MRTLALSKILLVAGLLAAPDLRAQDTTPPKGKHGKAQGKAKKVKTQDTTQATAEGKAKPVKVSHFWDSVDPFEMTLTLNLKRVRNDKMASAPWEPATLSFADSGTTVTLPIRVRTRGISRLKICTHFPPIWVDFVGGDTKKHIFSHVKRFKLVSPCKPQSVFERYVIEEYNLYRVLGLLTPVSHFARIVHVTVVDSASQKPDFTRYAYALEDVDDLAARLGGKKFAVEGATAGDMQQHQTAVFGLFEYMIGNTDFSIYALHNAELVTLHDGVYPIPHDFDQAGVINPPYAIPDPKLGIRNVTDRLYRGLCVSPDTIATVVKEFQDKRSAINALYADTIGKLISGNGAKESVRWFDDVFSDLANPKTVKNDILDKCRDVR